jgi:magnesium transporter
VQYIYVVSGKRFVGVLQMKDLLLSKINTRLSQIVIKNAYTVQDTATLQELIGFFDKYDFYGVPVLNDKKQMVGVVLRKHILEAENTRASIDMLSTQGIVGGEELRSMPTFIRSRRRLSWLSINILLNIAAASVIAFYQDTLSAVIALAVFLPIISDMSGCSGNQAVAVSMRELSLGVVKPFDVFRVLFKEVSIGLLNGAALGILIGLAAFIWKGNIYLGLVVGGALMINTVIAVSLGGTIPLILKRFGVDPALASGPILTTITDMMGFALVLSMATMAMAYI